MSNSTVFGYQVVHASKSLCVEHGDKAITIVALRHDSELRSISVELGPSEARALAHSLIKRADEIDPAGKEPPK